jgi:acetyl esterase
MRQVPPFFLFTLVSCVVSLSPAFVRAAETVGAPACAPSSAVKALLQKVSAAGNPLDSLTRENAPQLWLRREQDAKKIIKPLMGVTIKDVMVPARNHQIPIRIYRPAKPAARKLPTLLFFHGGGWTLGSIATYDSLARALAAKTPAVVVSVDYRLAPEQPFPAGLLDAQLAFEWALRNIDELGGDPGRIGVAGDSGGGNLATIVARKARAEGTALKLQALFYPSVHLARMDTPSYEANGKGYLLTKKSVETFRQLYAPKEEDWVKPDVSPLLAADEELAKLPPTFLLVVGCDPLRDEGLAYGLKLRANGVAVTTSGKEGMVHGFLNFFNGAATPELSREAERVVDEIAKWLRENFARPHV